ncbi:MAG: ketopantoate reductase [Myxococcales bacterium]|nr:ketopantoate reductase [Myxococcales bacterium]MCB9546702.1 ketopantoate reductase [Myxococcales bacterium]
MSGPRILLVGAGAVGQVYGFHLFRGGARVTFFVKEKYRAGLEADGMPLYPLKGPEKGRRVDFREFDLVSTPEEVAARAWDQVWLCMSSTALKGPWLEPLLAAAGEATVVSLQPGLEDVAYLLARMPVDRLVRGLIPMISYQAPLPGQHVDPPGVAFWWPAAKNPFSGPRDRLRGVIDLLNHGGWASKGVPDVTPQLALGSGLMNPVMAGLELSGWKFKAFGRGEGSRLAARAMKQTAAIAAPGRARVLVWLMARRTTLRLILWLGERLLPLPLEVYLGYHFTKVGDQTRAQLASFIEKGVAASKPVDAIRALADRLPPEPAGVP